MSFDNLDTSEHVDVDMALTALTAETTAAIKAIAAEVKRIGAQSDAIATKIARPGGLPAGFTKTDQFGNPELTAIELERKALATFVRTGEMKTMLVGSDPDGGYGVTPMLSADIVKRLYNLSPVRQICRVVEVGSFDSYQEPKQLGDTGASWIGEAEARPSSTTPTLGMIDIHVDELYSLQPVTQRLIDDSRFDMAAFVTERVSERMARAEGTAFVSGSGVNQPKGFMSYATDSAADFTRDTAKLQYVVSGSASAILLDGIKALFWTLRAPHRVSASWLMSSATASALDSLKTGAGDYVWRPSVAADQPPTLLGKPVYISEDMPAIAGGAFPIAFGNFNAGYVVAEKPGVRFLRDPYSSKPNVIFYAYRRVGGGVADTDAIKLLKIST